jgi:hypothetical protein
VHAGSSSRAHSIFSASGTQQGDPLGAFLFSIALHVLLVSISKIVPGLALNAWFMDDGTIAGPLNQVSQVLPLLHHEGAALGLEINLKKCVLYSPAGSPIPSDLFDESISRSVSGGITILGCPVGNPAFVKKIFDQKLAGLSCSLTKLTQLPNPQVAVRLLLQCVSFCKFTFFIRTIPPQLIGSHCLAFDRLIMDTLQSIIGVTFPLSATMQAALPIAVGGLGLRSTSLHMPAAYIASFNGVNRLMQMLIPSVDISILFSDSVLSIAKTLLRSNTVGLSASDLNVLYHTNSQQLISKALDESSFTKFFNDSSLDVKARARILALKDSPQGLAFSVPLAKARGFALSPDELRFLIVSRLGVDVLCNEGDLCELCHQDMDIAGYHMATCPSGPSVCHRHNALRDIVHDHCKKAAWSPSKEEHCFPSYPDSRTDIYLPRGSVGGGLALDVTVVHPLQKAILTQSSTSSLSGCNLGEKRKHDKYGMLCESANISFIPLVNEFYGCWGKEAVSFFAKLVKAIHSRFDGSESDISLQLYRQLSICLIRCNALAVLKRVPLPT